MDVMRKDTSRDERVNKIYRNYSIMLVSMDLLRLAKSQTDDGIHILV